MKSIRLRRASATAASALLVAGLAIAAGSPAQARDEIHYGVLRTVPVAGYPGAVAIDSTRHLVYSANYADATVDVVDESTDELVAVVDVGKGAQGVAIDPTRGIVYVTGFESNDISLIDETTNTVIDTIPTPPFPGTVAVDPSRHRLYVTSESEDTVTVIDQDTTVVVATIPVGDVPRGLSVDPTLGRGYVANYGSGSVSVFDLDSNTVVDSIPAGGHPQTMAIDPTTQTLYIQRFQSGKGPMSVVDLTTDTVTAVIRFPSGTFGFDVDPGERLGFVPNFYEGTVSVIDLTTNTVSAVVDVPGNPGFAAVDPVTHRVYVSRLGAIDHFGVLLSPSITRVVPAGGPTAGRAKVRVVGQHFLGTKQVIFGDAPARSFRIVSDTVIIARTPAHAAGPVDVRIDNGAALSPTTPADRYEFLAPER